VEIDEIRDTIREAIAKPIPDFKGKRK